MKTFEGLSLFLFAALFSGSAFAFPIANRVSLDTFRRPAVRAAGVNFEGIVALDDCSGAIVRYETSRDDDNAMVFTNGHCNEHGMPEPGTFVLNQSSSRGFAVLDPKSGRSLGTIRAEKILYGTMTKTDVTLYRLPMTYSDIYAKFHVRPLTLSSKQAAAGAKIEIVSGYWQRGYACAIDYFVDTLKEAGWTMRNSIRYTQPGCETIGGTSGSPIVLAGTDQMIGINNTGNEDGEKCTMNNPCEIDRDGKMTADRGASYGQNVALIYSCLDSQLRLDLSLKTCRLPGGARSGEPNVRRVR